MAIAKKSDQILYTGRGPLDSKSLVKTYADLFKTSTWTTQVNNTDTFTAYNGMVVAVWLNKDDTSKNGIYFLHDPAVTSVIKKPDVTNEANWHKIGGLSDLPGLAEQVTAIQNELNNVKSDIDELQDAATVVVDTKENLPLEGISGKLYIVTADAATFVWHNNGYLSVGDGSDHDHDEEIQIIMGGGPNG